MSIYVKRLLLAAVGGGLVGATGIYLNMPDVVTWAGCLAFGWFVPDKVFPMPEDKEKQE